MNAGTIHAKLTADIAGFTKSMREAVRSVQQTQKAHGTAMSWMAASLRKTTSEVKQFSAVNQQAASAMKKLQGAFGVGSAIFAAGRAWKDSVSMVHELGLVTEETRQ